MVIGCLSGAVASVGVLDSSKINGQNTKIDIFATFRPQNGAVSGEFLVDFGLQLGSHRATLGAFLGNFRIFLSIFRRFFSRLRFFVVFGGLHGPLDPQNIEKRCTVVRKHSTPISYHFDITCCYIICDILFYYIILLCTKLTLFNPGGCIV